MTRRVVSRRSGIIKIRVDAWRIYRWPAEFFLDAHFPPLFDEGLTRAQLAPNERVHAFCVKQTGGPFAESRFTGRFCSRVEYLKIIHARRHGVPVARLSALVPLSGIVQLPSTVERYQGEKRHSLRIINNAVYPGPVIPNWLLRWVSESMAGELMMLPRHPSCSTSSYHRLTDLLQ